jgi:hypothetical protein
MARLYSAAYASSTVRTHQAGWLRWVGYLGDRDPYMRGASLLEQRCLLAGFCEHLVFASHCTKGTVGTVQSAIVNQIARDLGGSVNLYGDVVIRQVFSIAKAAASKVNQPKLKVRVLPLTQEIGQASRAGASVGDADYRMADLAMRLGQRLGCRPSELVATGQSKHYLISNQVSFHSVSAPPTLGSDGDKLSQDASNVRSVKLNWNTSKTGRRVHYLERSTAVDDELVSDLVEWARHGQLLPADPFFTSYRAGRRKVMTSKMLTAHIRSFAQAAGLASTSLGPKSMRVGRATELSAAGASKTEIDESVQWSTKSRSSLTYTRVVPPSASGGIKMEHLRVMGFMAGQEGRGHRVAAPDGVPRDPRALAEVPGRTRGYRGDALDVQLQQPGNSENFRKE